MQINARNSIWDIRVGGMWCDCEYFETYIFGWTRDRRYYVGANYCVFIDSASSLVLAKALLHEGYGKFMLFRVEPGGEDNGDMVVREWRPSDGFKPGCYASLRVDGGFTRWWFLGGLLMASGEWGGCCCLAQPHRRY